MSHVFRIALRSPFSYSVRDWYEFITTNLPLNREVDTDGCFRMMDDRHRFFQSI